MPLTDGHRVIGVFGQVTQVEVDQELTHIRTSRRARWRCFGLLQRGHTTAQMAQELHLSIETVRNHVAAILRTLGVHSRVEAVTIGAAGFPPAETSPDRLPRASAGSAVRPFRQEVAPFAARQLAVRDTACGGRPRSRIDIPYDAEPRVERRDDVPPVGEVRAPPRPVHTRERRADELARDEIPQAEARRRLLVTNR